MEPRILVTQFYRIMILVYYTRNCSIFGLHSLSHDKVKDKKGKIHSRSDHEGSEREGRKGYNFVLSLISVLDWGGWLMPCHGCFTARNDPVPIVQETG